MNGKISKLAVFMIAFVISLFVVFFIGKKHDATTGTNHFVLALDGITQFRKGLDVAGGIKLTYKVDYSKYKEIYKDTVEFNRVKSSIEGIILKNIDSRISKLGVSDYNAYPQILNNENYIVIEIGGISDIEEAKKIIWRTVELEFKLPNEQWSSPQWLAQRKSLAQTLLIDAKNGNLSGIAAGRAGDDIYYNRFDSLPLSQLPVFYTTHLSKINSLSNGQLLNEVIGWLYHTFTQQDDKGVETTQTLTGSTIVKLLDKKILTGQVVSPNTLASASALNGLVYEDQFSLDRKGLNPVESPIYNANQRSIIFNSGVLFSGQAAYEVTIIRAAKSSSLTTGQDDANQELSGKVSVLASLISKGQSPGFASGIQQVASGWIDEAQLKSVIVNFNQTTPGVKTYDQLDGWYIVQVRTAKSANQPLYHLSVIKNVSPSLSSKVLKDTTTQILYTVEDIFVRDTNSWVIAKDPQTSEILNGAFFKFANIDKSQTGQPVVVINLDEKGKNIFCNVSTQSIGKQMAIFVGGNLLTAPTIRDKICGGSAQIDGQFDIAGAKQLVDSLNEGTLPAKLILAHEEKISPVLGAHAMQGAIIALGLSFIAIAILMIVMYGWKKALIAMFAMTVFLAVLFAAVKLIDYALSLSGIAAIILTIGMGIDASILIFERVLEELKSGKTMQSAIEIGHERSWAPIRDGNISTGLIAFLLFTMGINIFKGFGAMMLVNMIMILVIMVPLIKELLTYAYAKKADYTK